MRFYTPDLRSNFALCFRQAIFGKFFRHSGAVFTLSIASLLGSPNSYAAIDVAELYSYANYSNFALSPSGRYVAIGDNRNRKRAQVMIVDLQDDTKSTKFIVGETPIVTVQWATDDRLVLSAQLTGDIKLPSGYYIRYKDGDRSRYLRNMRYSRMIAVDRNGTNPTLLFKDAKRGLRSNQRLDKITSSLPDDPDHVLIPAFDKGLNLYKVNIHTGSYKKLEDGRSNTFAYNVDRSGYPIARYDSSSRGRFVRIHVRDKAIGKWSKLATVREEDLDLFRPVAGTDISGEMLVSASPDGADKAAIYRYDLENERFIEKVASHPEVDIRRAIVDADGKYVASVFREHRLTYDFADPEAAQHMAKLNAKFDDTTNVSLQDVSTDRNVWLVKTSGPRDPGTMYSYDTIQKTMLKLARLNADFPLGALSDMEVIDYTASDGKELHGYLTRPKGATSQTPLVVLVHGGPEARDKYDYNPMSQYLASTGFSVFQPQFRGSSGYGKAFAAEGYGEWGGRMQDDVTDGVEHLFETGKASRSNLCIAGASYGGYAALMGAVKTPDLYKCAVSIAGVSDLPAMAAREKKEYGSRSEIYDYVKKTMGDPKRDMQRMVSTSPAYQAKNIKIPIQLIHGSDDDIVPISQSETMRDALTAAGHTPEYIRLDGIDHSLRGKRNFWGQRTALENMRIFLNKHLTHSK